MDQAKALLTRRANLGSGAIRAVTWSAWSHVQVARGGELFGASFPHGVGKETLAQRLELSSHAALVAFNVPDLAAGDDFLRKTQSYPYDWKGAFGLAVHQDWQSRDAFWCSSYFVAYLQACGLSLYREGAIRRITPQHIFMLNFPTEYLK